MLDRVARGIQRHWLALIVSGLLFYSLLPFVAPILLRNGYTTVAQAIYVPYKFVCHTYGFRSFYLYGEQPVYTRDEFDRLSSIDTSSLQGLFAARDFQGNAQMGYKVALCERDVAIYLSLALNGIAFGWLRRRQRLRALPWWTFVLIGLVPIGLDGFSQLFSQPPFNLIPYRESVWWMRMLTGSLFGTSVAWLVLPLVQGAFEETGVSS